LTLRFCIVAYTGHPDMGSADMHTWQVARHLLKAGHEVHMILPSMDVEEDGLKLHFLDMKKRRRLGFALRAAWLCRKLDDLYLFDVIYTRSLQNAFALVFGDGGRHGKFCIEVNGIWSDEHTLKTSSSARWLKRAFLRRLEIWVLDHAHLVFPVSDGIKQEFVYRGMDAERIVVVENGTDIERFRPQRPNKAIDELRHGLGIGPDEKVVFFSGRFYPWQQVPSMIRAAPMILEKVPEARFLMVGDGEMRAEWNALIDEVGVKDRFILTGRVPHDHMPKYIALADACYAPLKAAIKGSPLKVREFMACGKPVVATDSPTFHAVAEHGAGVLVDVEDPQDVARGFIEILSDPKAAARMGKNGRKAAEQLYSWEKVAGKLASACEG